MSGFSEISNVVGMAGQQHADAMSETLTRQLENADSGSAREAAEQFEAYFVESMLKEMRKTVPKMGESSGQAMEIFEGLFDKEISSEVSKGRGLGLADMIENSLLRAAQNVYDAPKQLNQTEMSNSLKGLISMGRITSKFGARHDPISGEHKHHDGLDIAMTEGTELRPIRAGTVTFSGHKGGYGNVVVVDHGGGFESMYAHLKNRAVEVGEQVSAAHILGQSGNTGRSTGPHLHLEVRQNGKAVDPDQFISQ